MGIFSKFKTPAALVLDGEYEKPSSSPKKKDMTMNSTTQSDAGEPPGNVVGGPKLDNPVELGHVHFLRNLDDAYALARETQRPIFLLFQEIPGCRTCTNFGRNVLQNEEITQAVRRAFVPVAINNRCLIETDAHVCSKFKEPMLNNPVVRFIDANGNDLVPRKAGIYSATQLIPRMKQALTKLGREDLVHHFP